MKNLTNTTGQSITNEFQHIVFQNRQEALNFAICDMGWDSESIIDNTDTINLEVENTVVSMTLNCMYVDSGSEDYIYYIN